MLCYRFRYNVEENHDNATVQRLRVNTVFNMYDIDSDGALQPAEFREL